MRRHHVYCRVFGGPNTHSALPRLLPHVRLKVLRIAAAAGPLQQPAGQGVPAPALEDRSLKQGTGLAGPRVLLFRFLQLILSAALAPDRTAAGETVAAVRTCESSSSNAWFGCSAVLDTTKMVFAKWNPAFLAPTPNCATAGRM
jgi:hypothetical protein